MDSADAVKFLESINACQPGIDYVGGYTLFKDAYDNCIIADWLWLLAIYTGAYSETQLKDLLESYMSGAGLDWSNFHPESRSLRLFNEGFSNNNFYYIVRDICRGGILEFLFTNLDYDRIETAMEEHNALLT